MKHIIESEDLQVEINSIGMEISSIQSKLSKQEYLWQGDPSIWEGQAPVLFPIVGALKDGFTKYNGNEYRIPKHGLVRNSDQVKLLEATTDSLRFGMFWNTETLKKYPFKFELEILFKLEGKTITISHLIRNQGEEEMLYSIGGHPAFNCPLREGEKYEEYELKFAEKENDSTWLIDQAGLVSGKQKPTLNNTEILSLHKNLFNQDALIFKNLKSREVTLQHRKKGGIISVEFSDFDYLGIWAKPNAPFVCIEPWLGIADSADSNQNLKEKEGILLLSPGQSDKKSYAITVLE
jgi:galactose mutarotase-like enzyme